MTYDTLEQLERSGILRYVKPGLTVDGKNISGYLDVAAIDELELDPSFAKGGLHKLHPEVGDDLIDFRSFRGAFGEGSLQIVIDQETGRFHADIDKWNPYADVVNIFGHTFGEVLPNWAKRLFKRKKSDAPANH